MQRWGLYIHVPFCTSICPYCDFNVYKRRHINWRAFGHALVAELQYAASHEFAGAPPLYSVYFGGGTPSLAPPELIAQVIDAARGHFGVQGAAEITLEANPGTVDAQRLAGYADAGVNRLSLGWQSTHNRLLKRLGRAHSAADSEQALYQARAAKLHNISLDLIFAVPTQTEQECAQDVQRIVQHAPSHVSLYALTYHAGTPFFRRRAQRRLHPASEETEVAMMAQIQAGLTAAGYVHYEVSNYCKPGQQARHNALYWQGQPYLGIGPGAHSFVHHHFAQGSRWETTRCSDSYMSHWAGTRRARTEQWRETLDAKALFTERMLGATRHTGGINLRDETLQPHQAKLDEAVPQALSAQWATLTDSQLVPTSAGLLHADALASLFF